jgi:gluconate 2-dehydrogenase subunit 3-like protein
MEKPAPPDPSPIANVTRRAALKALGVSLGTAAALPWLSDEGLLAFARIQETSAPSRPKALSASQFQTLETLVEAIIPADDRSAGAKDARVADYIDLWLSEADSQVALQWSGGLALVDTESTARFRTPFVRLNAAQADTILAHMSRNERAPQTPLETFFVMTKQATVIGYYTSKIGIHDELHYKGNVFLRDFVGCQTEDGKDCPHCGQKHV